MYDRSRPDWVMCGVPWDDKVGILASTELNQAELEAERDLLDPVDPFEILGPVRMTPMRYSLVVQMRSFVLVVADTYEQAFRSLFDQWTPARAERRPLTATRPQIGRGQTPVEG